MPLNQKIKTKLKVVGLYSIFTVALAGSLVGTFAWYTYGARASILYEGSSAGGHSGLFEVGLIGDQIIEDDVCEELNLYREDYKNNRYIYWANGEVIQGSALNKIMEINGYAYQGMSPCTAEKRALITDEPVVLKNNPIKGEKYESDIELAPHRSYAYFEFVTRKVNPDNPGGDYLSHTVSVSSFGVSSDTKIHQSMRFVVNSSDGVEHYLVNPSQTDHGYNNAAGPLDLNEDSYYDCVRYRIGSETIQREFAYGTWEDGPYWKDTPEENSTHLAKEECGTFIANHAKGTYALDMERSIPAKIEYFGTSDFISSAVTIGESSSYHNYAFFDISLFLEGWDLSVDNQEAYKNFTFQLEFDVA